MSFQWLHSDLRLEEMYASKRFRVHSVSINALPASMNNIMDLPIERSRTIFFQLYGYVPFVAPMDESRYCFPWYGDATGTCTKDQKSRLLVEAMQDMNVKFTVQIHYGYINPPPNVVHNR